MRMSVKTVEMEMRIDAITNEELTDKLFSSLVAELIKCESLERCYSEREIITTVTKANWGELSSILLEWVGSPPKAMIFFHYIDDDSPFIAYRRYGDRVKTLDSDTGKAYLLQKLVFKYLCARKVDV